MNRVAAALARRTAIAASTAGRVPPMAAPQIHDVDVVVVGAGLAGLAAAES